MTHAVHFKFVHNGDLRRFAIAGTPSAVLQDVQRRVAGIVKKPAVEVKLVWKNMYHILSSVFPMDTTEDLQRAIDSAKINIQNDETRGMPVCINIELAEETAEEEREPRYCEICCVALAEQKVQCSFNESHVFCLDCTRDWLDENLYEKDIFCPSVGQCPLAEGCPPWTFTEAEMKEYLGEDYYEEFKKEREIALAAAATVDANAAKNDVESDDVSFIDSDEESDVEGAPVIRDVVSIDELVAAMSKDIPEFAAALKRNQLRAEWATDTEQKAPLQCQICRMILGDEMVQCPSMESHVFCLDCTRGYLKFHVSEKTIYCPSGDQFPLKDNCPPWTLTDAEMREYLGEEYDEFKKKVEDRENALAAAALGAAERARLQKFLAAKNVVVDVEYDVDSDVEEAPMVSDVVTIDKCMAAFVEDAPEIATLLKKDQLSAADEWTVATEKKDREDALAAAALGAAERARLQKFLAARKYLESSFDSDDDSYVEEAPMVSDVVKVGKCMAAFVEDAPEIDTLLKKEQLRTADEWAVGTEENESRHCQICRVTLSDQLVQCPNSESHVFCLDCIRGYLKFHVGQKTIYCPSGDRFLLSVDCPPWTFSDAEMMEYLGEEYEEFKKQREDALAAAAASDEAYTEDLAAIAASSRAAAVSNAVTELAKLCMLSMAEDLHEMTEEERSPCSRCADTEYQLQALYNAGFADGAQYQAGLTAGSTGKPLPRAGYTAEFESGHNSGVEQMELLKKWRTEAAALDTAAMDDTAAAAGAENSAPAAAEKEDAAQSETTLCDEIKEAIKERVTFIEKKLRCAANAAEGAFKAAAAAAESGFNEFIDKMLKSETAAEGAEEEEKDEEKQSCPECPKLAERIAALEMRLGTTEGVRILEQNDFDDLD